MRRVALAAVVALAVVVAPSAGAAGPVISYTITAGTAGDNGWYRSAVTVKLDVTGTVTGSTCPLVYTFKSSTDILQTLRQFDAGVWYRGPQTAFS